MSDYISKSALLEQFFKDTPHCQYVGIKYVDDLIKNFPTVDEKEIVRKPMERIVERLENCSEAHRKLSTNLKKYHPVESENQLQFSGCYQKAIEIVKEECGD